MKKTLFSLFIAIVASVCTASAVVYTGNCGAEGDGSNLQYYLETDNGVLIITGSGQMEDNSIWYTLRNYVTAVSLPDGLKNIGNYAFNGFSKLESITIPNSVTSIGSSAFSYSHLTSVTFPSNLKIIKDRAFSGCEYLTEVILPEGLETIEEYAFARCRGMVSLSVPNSVTEIGESAFWDCDNVASEVYTDKFYIKLPRNTRGAYTIPSGVEVIADDACAHCVYITSVTVPEGVTTLGRTAFGYCENLKTVSLPSTLTTIVSAAFYWCWALRTINIPNSVTEIGDLAFDDCYNLDATDGIRYAGPYLIEPVDKTQSTYTIKEGTKWIGSTAFEGCTNMTSIDLPEGIHTIYGGAFMNCVSLSSVVIPQGVEYIGASAFSACRNLPSVTIPNSVKVIDFEAFDECTSLSEVHITDIKSWCEINFSYYKSNPVYYAQKLYVNGALLTDLNGLTGISSIGAYAFANCMSLGSVVIPDNITEIGTDAFFNIANIIYAGPATENAPWGARNMNGFIEDNLIYRDATKTTLTVCLPAAKGEIVIPNTVDTIGDNAFVGCIDVTSVIIPASVLWLGYDAFTSCTNLRVARLEGTSLNLSDRYYNYGNLYPFLENTIIYVPLGSLNAYRTAPVWDRRPRSLRVMDLVAGDVEVASTSVAIKMGDAKTRQYIASCGIDGGEEFAGNIIEYSSLDPESEYADIPLFIRTTAGDYDTIHYSFKTTALELATQPAHLTSETSAVLLANTNMADIEVSCGFEFRRTAASDAVPSQMIGCPVANGTMAVKVKNIKSGTEYKFRPYYTSAAGNTFYGDWSAFDPQDAYITYEPVIYTYPAYAVTETEATLKGYALEGSEDFDEQGFEVWADSRMIPNAAPAIRKSVIGEKQKYPASGISMSVTLTDLDAGTVYKYRTYAKMDDQTVYGPEMSFTTQGEYVEPTAIEEFDKEVETGSLKLLMDGHLYILREGHVYSITGAEIR